MSFTVVAGTVFLCQRLCGSEVNMEVVKYANSWALPHTCGIRHSQRASHLCCHKPFRLCLKLLMFRNQRLSIILGAMRMLLALPLPPRHSDRPHLLHTSTIRRGTCLLCSLKLQILQDTHASEHFKLSSVIYNLI